MHSLVAATPMAAGDSFDNQMSKNAKFVGPGGRFIADSWRFARHRRSREW
jgi:hypothetical protein